jgi:hypothetical protein
MSIYPVEITSSWFSFKTAAALLDVRLNNLVSSRNQRKKQE